MTVNAYIFIFSFRNKAGLIEVEDANLITLMEAEDSELRKSFLFRRVLHDNHTDVFVKNISPLTEVEKEKNQTNI